MILDTNAVSAIVGNDRTLFPILAGIDEIQLPVIVIGEYDFGLLGSTRAVELQAAWSRLLDSAFVLPIEETACSIYASVKHDLKKRGHPIPNNDIWIAALALQHDPPIVSRDTHFDVVEGVTRIGW